MCLLMSLDLVYLLEAGLCKINGRRLKGKFKNNLFCWLKLDLAKYLSCCHHFGVKTKLKLHFGQSYINFKLYHLLLCLLMPFKELF